MGSGRALVMPMVTPGEPKPMDQCTVSARALDAKPETPINKAVAAMTLAMLLDGKLMV
jgi:hypothetical protein